MILPLQSNVHMGNFFRIIAMIGTAIPYFCSVYMGYNAICVYMSIELKSFKKVGVKFYNRMLLFKVHLSESNISQK